MSEDEAKDLLRLSVRLAVEARDVHLQENPGRRDRPPLIAGSVGPFGAYNSPDAAEYHGNYVDSMSVEVCKCHITGVGFNLQLTILTGIWGTLDLQVLI